MQRQLIVGIMGGGAADKALLDKAFHLGRLIAENNWILLNGGRDAGIMGASARGAAEHGGMIIGILPGDTLAGASPYLTIPVRTGMGNARNCINVLSSDIIVAYPGGAGTLSEIALALKHNKPVITLGFSLPDLPGLHLNRDRLFSTQTPESAIEIIKDQAF
ncbi:MAG: TIGR00725 family protein [Thermodesulfobacteriota bacterium]|nr:TIGR00725 family protein [Thermodesulfobacteriota bacterium]